MPSKTPFLLSHSEAGEALVVQLLPGQTLVVETAAGKINIATDRPNDVEDQTELTITPTEASWVYSLDQPDAATILTGVSGFTITMQSRENAF